MPRDGREEQPDSVLVVDDEAPLRRIIELTLIDGGYECRACGSAAEALALLEARQPDLVVLDFRLGGSDGPTVYAAIRDQGFEGPVLFLTALGRHDDGLRRIEQLEGPTSLMLKPFDPEKLLERVSSLLAQAGGLSSSC
jgi:DNA-binding response OmpR family regulator